MQVDQLRGIIDIYQVSQHHNLVKLEDYFENKENIYLCLELHSSDTFLEFIKGLGERLAEYWAREIYLRIISAVEYLHDHGLVLRNLDSDSILMSKVPADTPLHKATPRIGRLNRAQLIGSGG